MPRPVSVGTWGRQAGFILIGLGLFLALARWQFTHILPGPLGGWPSFSPTDLAEILGSLILLTWLVTHIVSSRQRLGLQLKTSELGTEKLGTDQQAKRDQVLFAQVSAYGKLESSMMNDFEKELQNPKQILQLVLDNMCEGVAMANAQGRLVYFNQAAEKLCGKPPSSGSAAEWPSYFGMLSPDSEKPFPYESLPIYRAIALGETTQDCELLIRNESHPEGIYISVSGRPIYEQNGRLAGAVTVFRDISESKRVAWELKSGNERFETLARVTNDVVWDWNVKSGEVWHNEAFSRLLGNDVRAPPICRSGGIRFTPMIENVFGSRLEGPWNPVRGFGKKSIALGKRDLIRTS